MVDYAIDENFDLRDQLLTVDGKEEFHQDLVIAIDEKFSGVLGSYKTVSNIEEKVHLLATRIAKEFDVIDRIQRINVYELQNAEDTISVEIEYITGDAFQETL